MVNESGSGINIYVIQSNNPLNTTMTLNGNKPTIVSVAENTDPAYNVTYTVQNLPPTQHILNVTFVDHPDGTTTRNVIRFDYAAVNESSPSMSSPSSSGASAATPGPAQSSGSAQSGSASASGPK